MFLNVIYVGQNIIIFTGFRFICFGIYTGITDHHFSTIAALRTHLLLIYLLLYMVLFFNHNFKASYLFL